MIEIGKVDQKASSVGHRNQPLMFSINRRSSYFARRIKNQRLTVFDQPTMLFLLISAIDVLFINR